MVAVKFVLDPPGSRQLQRGYLISAGWPHYAHGCSVLSAPCNNVAELRRTILELKAQLDTALADGENFLNQLGKARATGAPEM